jgi:probable phosphoglycerate mutase
MNTIYLIRHGQTEWSKSGQHTSYTDLKLTLQGVVETKAVARHLPHFDHVFISPLKRALQSAEILNLKGLILNDLVEWNYGVLEGKTSEEIKGLIPDWSIFTHGALFGETVQEVTVRADKVIQKLVVLNGNIAIVSSGHFLRVLASRWILQPCEFGKHLLLSTASISILSKDRGIPVISAFNQKSL